MWVSYGFLRHAGLAEVALKGSGRLGLPGRPGGTTGEKV